MAELNNVSTNDILLSNEQSIASLSISNDSKNNITQNCESQQEINEENLNRNNVDIDIEMVDNNNGDNHQRLLLELESESHSLLDSDKFAKKISKEHSHLLSALKKPPSIAKQVNNNNNNNVNTNDNHSESKEEKQNHEYIKEFINNPNKNAIGEKYQLTFHPSRTFAYNIYDKFQVLNNFNKKECKDALKRFTNHIQNLEQKVIHKIAKLEIKNAAKKKERKERKEKQKRQALQNNANNAAQNIEKYNREDEKMSMDMDMDGESDSDSDSDYDNNEGEEEGDIIDPTKWIVPEWCIPLRADIRTFHFEKLANMQKSLTGGRLFDVIMMDPPWQLASNNPTRGVAIGYSQLDDNIISSIPIPLLQKNGLLFIWVINAKYRMAIHLFAKWGYTIIQDIAWVKQTVNRRLANGHGYYLQHAKETCLIGLKGDLNQIPNVNNACADVIYSERRGQSQKPEEIYEYIEKLVPNGYYMEIFGRRNNLRNCWVTVGNEL